MYRKFNKPKIKNYTDELGYGYNGQPKGDDTPNTYISNQSLRNLPHSSYSFAADPYQAALPTSEPYPILNKFNSAIGGNYAGENNIDGGNVQQYANSTTSKFLAYFDEMRLKINVNYRLLPVVPQTDAKYAGIALIDEMRKSIAESVSILKSTTFTQMAINNFAVVTDLPMGTATTTNIAPSGDPINAYTSTTDVIYAMSIYYQIFLQNMLGVMNWHNSFRLKQGVAIKNAWNREVPALNSFFGLMNKKAFLSLLDSINLSFEGEYVDKVFMEQANVLSLIPSRRSNSITDPILELQIGWNHPTVFKVYVLNSDGKIADPDALPLYDDSKVGLQINNEGTTEFVSFWTACDKLRDYLSLEATSKWARESFVAGITPTSDNTRYNQIKAYFDVLVMSMTLFKPYWSDYREALDTMTRTGTISWTKGFRPGITKDTSVDLKWNLMIDAIYQMTFSGASGLNYDEDTKRWKTFSLWNMYSGIPTYDTKSGGAFLTLSFKNIPSSSTTAEQFEYLPLIFRPYKEGAVACVALSRDGREAVITQFSTTMSSNVILQRLAPLDSQANLEIRVPTVAFANNSNLQPQHFSTLYKTLTQVFGMCRLQSASNGVYDFALDPDILAIYQIEISDITNMAITYARANAPFRGTTSDAGVLGFASFSKA